MSNLTHIDGEGNSRMVEVGPKPITNREAMAEGFIELTPEAMQHLHSGVNAKGDVLTLRNLLASGCQKHQTSFRAIEFRNWGEVLFERRTKGLGACITSSVAYRGGNGDDGRDAALLPFATW